MFTPHSICIALVHCSNVAKFFIIDSKIIVNLNSYKTFLKYKRGQIFSFMAQEFVSIIE